VGDGPERRRPCGARSARIDRNPDNNDYGAACVAAHRDRLHQFADIDCRWSPEYHKPGAADRVRKLVDRIPVEGVTHYVALENDGWFLSAEGTAFFRVLAERRLILSLAASPAWQDDLRIVARAFPTLPILCHHLAGIGSWAGGREDGVRRVVASAQVPSILVKISGFHYGADEPWAYPHSESQWVVRAIYEAFGAHRMCWGSDYPVVRRALTYRQSIEAFRSHCTFVSPADRAAILGGTLDTILRTREPIGAAA
jgi:predicted TIM-barrel fold metal-dependent hydrolase